MLVPIRRGRAQSEGAYQESYQCGREASGIDRAVEALDGVFQFLRKQPWANSDQMLIGGQSRGGLLAVVYAAQEPLYSATTIPPLPRRLQGGAGPGAVLPLS